MPPYAPASEPPPKPAVPVSELVMTAKADGKPCYHYIEAGWTKEQLIAEGYAEELGKP